MSVDPPFDLRTSTVETVLGTISDVAVQSSPGCAASVTLMTPARPTTFTSSGSVAKLLDETQAIGIIMGRDGCTPEEAFATLRTASQHVNRKLRDLAGELVEEATRPGRPEQPLRPS